MMDVLDRLGSRLKVGDECWEWTGATDRDGYGIMTDAGTRSVRVHRIVWELFNPPIPDGLQLDHLCSNRPCARPAHLEVVTCRENVMRGNTPQAINAAKTHCPKGHEFSPDNTGLGRRKVGEPYRYCRICRRAQWRKWYEAQK